MVSIIFNKQLFERDFLLEWLGYFGIHAGAAGKSSRIPNASKAHLTYLFFDQIDEYGDGIGIYRKNIREPVAFMENERVAILINLFVDPEDDGKLCTVTYMAMTERLLEEI